MPSCEPCGTFYNPNTLRADGSCPECGELVTAGEHVGTDAPIERKVPWHFWVGVAAVTLYLGWRLVQGVALLF
ncbi:MAG: hypothetical protein ACR2PK_01150 [Acidimicrobiales bacterium]